MTVTVAITLKPEPAGAIVDRSKGTETRPSPPNGDMRPAGVRGLPGCAINDGDRIAIHRGGKDGAIVATARVATVARCVTAEGTPDYVPAVVRHGERLELWRWWRGVGLQCTNISDQLPHGDFTVGRWVWVLHQVEVLEQPIPCKGKQGVWRLPAAIADRLNQERAA